MSENVGDVSTAEWDKRVLESKGVVMVDFWAPWGKAEQEQGARDFPRD